MRRFTEVVEELELRDYPLQGGPFTWRGGLNNQLQSRLDRFLVTDDWDRLFNGAVQGVLARPISDHFPILLEGGGLKRGPSPFRFENMWLEEKGFMDQMKRWWGSLSFTGSFSFVLDAKLRALKDILKSWNKEVFGLIESKKREALGQVEHWDEVEKHSPLSLEDCEARKEAQEAYKSWVLREEISWRQKSRELWLKEGDNNTRFFHRMANFHFRRNWLSKLKVNGCWHTEENNLKRSVVGAFKALYTEEGGWRPSVEGLPLRRLASCEAEGLETPFSEGEVYAALSDLGKDKAPGPDGFTMAFWLFCWDVVKMEIMGFFMEFHERGRFVKSLNATFLVLVPKKGGAEDLKDFRPISLVGSLYKLLAKSQNAFVEGRQILDAVLIANEAVDSRLKDEEGGVLCKLDIEKAYDHVCWKFLLAVLKKMGFGERWLKWIEWCISTVKFSVLINGSPTGFFQSSRGLRQGDPLSPYLFVIAMEVFSCMVGRAISGGFLSGWKVGGRSGLGLQISHLLFADDTLVFCEESADQMTYLSWLLMWFEACSGLKINLEKSELISVGRVHDIEGLALELGCKVGRLPSCYLGLPLGAPFNSLAVWDGVEERFRRRLAMWKRQYISKGGRLTLIRSTLSSMPIYFMSLFHLPRKVKLRLEKIQRDFLWGGGDLIQKPHLVRWNVVCLGKNKGGLGVRNLALMNSALLCKWNWRFANEREVLWRRVIMLKYGEEEGGWRTRDAIGRNGVGLWKAIRKKGRLLDGKLDYQVGNGKRVKFWKDKWCEDGPLCESFPSLFSISLTKNAWVSEVWNPVSDGDGWTPLFTRAFNDWEIESVERLLQKIHVCRVQRDEEDKVIWTVSKNGAFSVKSLYSILERGGSSLFPSKSIWRVRVPPKVAFFAWEASWGKVLTLEQLQRRGYSLANRCFLCLSEAETVDHLLLHCVKTRVLWNLLFSLFGVAWILPCSVKETLIGWNGGFVGKRRKRAWQMAPLCIFWSVWKERNSLAFGNVELSLQRLKYSFVSSLWCWVRASLGANPSSIVSFLDWLGS
ncbi:hypothetical protein PVL29_008942 [Vitis rotundifolia]|uniref:Reverse transcriptase domain-containing protein n=1 Tax=Vitis rotundifolia TaxID=103349 RepID=A0AA38ZX54_VITRO|nr:hypothetical protein PVL29_008942 [Vitis rotundifolia]